MWVGGPNLILPLLALTLLYDRVGSESNDVRRDGSNSNNRISRRERTPVPNYRQQAQNVTSLINLVDNSCSVYCANQTQYNGACVKKGCSSWKIALQEGCLPTCNGVENSYRENYACQIGCTRTVQDYYFKLFSILSVGDGPEPPPTLLSDSLKSTSLHISWEGLPVEQLPYLSYTVQKRTVNDGGDGVHGLWETVEVSPLNHTQLTVVNLKPYTQYQFRVGWILAIDFPPLYTRESNPIQTLAKGLPSAPTITSVQPISNTSVAVTWTPPIEPNGRLVAFILKLQPLPNGHAVIKEIPILQSPRSYTFTGLHPMTNYSLAISAQNLEGEGETANVHFTTPQSSLVNELSTSPEARLVVQATSTVYIQPLDLLMEPDLPLFTSSNNVSAIALHIQRGWVFVTTSESEIRRISLRGDSESNRTVVIVTRGRLDFDYVAHLAVDWLHNHLFIVGKKRHASNWVIKRCNLDGFELVTIYSSLPTKPLHFAADPFTGYLYWVSPPSHSRGGLYKLDLVAGNIPNRSVAQAVLEGNDLGPFTLDVSNYRILIIHKGMNTVLSVSLDGDTSDIRGNTQSPQWGEAVSLALHNNVLFWTTPTSLRTEEYNAAADTYYQNSFDVPKASQPLGSLLVLHPDVQPTPVPMAAPQQVQVLYGQTKARVTWKPPPTISSLGGGAWRNWSYQVKLSDNRLFANITTTEVTINGLKPSTFYSVQVLAYSESGRGPISSPNRGKTLRETTYNVTLLWGSSSGLYATDTLGDHLQLLASTPINTRGIFPGGSSVSKGNIGNGGELSMSSLTWYESTVFFALSNGTVFYYAAKDDTSKTTIQLHKENNVYDVQNSVSLLRGVSSAQSIAFDWIGQRLYWSNPKQQTIFRCYLGNLSSSLSCLTREPLQLVTMAREIAIDSYKGLLLWSTGHSIEMARMNGYAHGTLFQHGMFSGRQIMGMTLDTEQSRIYWITRSASGSIVQRLHYNIRGAQLPMIIANYEDTTITGPIRYFNDRLLWLQGSSEAVIKDLTDLYGHGKSSLKLSTVENITNVHVKDQGAIKYPGGLPKTKIQVNPSPVPRWSVDITGRWNNFSVVWHPVNNTNYGKVLYEVVINNALSRVTEHTNITVENNKMFSPYTEVAISITALTYWSSASPTLCRRRIPSWKPSEPLNPRAYVQRLPSFPYTPSLVETNNATMIRAELRWDEPQNQNGLILGYLVQCWKGHTKLNNCTCDVDMNELSCELKTRFDTNRQYHFEVQAYTSAGVGSYSKKVLVDTGFNSPVPKLFITKRRNLEILDIDRNRLEEISLGYISPISATFLSVENTVYWFNEGQDLFMSKMDSHAWNKSRILSLNGQWEAGHLIVDWIGRKLYWAVQSTDRNKDFSYGIMSLDLSALDNNSNFSSIKPQTVVHSKSGVRALAFNPFSNALYWTTSKRPGYGGMALYTADERDNFTVKPFISRHLTDPGSTCNCSKIVLDGDPVSFDPTGYGPLSRAIYFLGQGSIWAADDMGCYCVHVLNTTLVNASTTTSGVQGDATHIYWTGEKGYILAAEKRNEGLQGVTELVSSGVRELKAFGPYSQPFPTEVECLIPRRMEPNEPQLFNHSSHSLHLNLPSGVNSNCSEKGLSLPSPHYSVYYGTVDENLISKCTPSSPSHCKMIRTMERSLHINDLHPFTTYTVFVTLTNYYSKMAGLPPLVCSPIMRRTAPGAPMPPKLLRLELLTPSAIRVVWNQPEKLNGEKVWYEVHWKTSGSGSSIAKWAETESKSNTQKTELSLELSELEPSSKYTVWVRAFSEKGDAFSDSTLQTVTTYPYPNNITLEKTTPHNLNLSWLPPGDNSIIKHQLIYKEGSSLEWNEEPKEDFTIPGLTYYFNMSSLKPKTLYVFRLRAWYRDYAGTPFLFPTKAPFHFETRADKPSPPVGRPIARGIGKALYEVSWKDADENGAEIIVYSLETKLVSYPVNNQQTQDQWNDTSGITIVPLASTYAPTPLPVTTNSNTGPGRQRSSLVKREVINNPRNFSIASDDLNGSVMKSMLGKWVEVYKGKDTRWVVTGLNTKGFYNFRVRANNTYGWGEYSNESGIVSLEELTLVAEPQHVGVVIGTILSSTLILGLFAVLFILLYRRRLQEKPILRSPFAGGRRELELATLRELPGGSSFVHQSNVLYSAGDLIMDLDLAGVPKVKWDQIRITKFLGSGAFGEVFEGIATNLRGSGDPELQVAVKTLRKLANTNEKQEFIQEAKLMAQFRHPHIIQLVGIGVDTDPCYLLLELMGEGDLLSYLRLNRPNQPTTTPLNLVDLLQMCVDVSKGCVYLEELHFVHRDIAARNCLVSLLPEMQNTRIVKIGDFGLARDIYRNDYYRKDGEGLLPVRWMAPESLVDGIFTTQTDVWAFGVLLWEIMTLGQQPYPARSNVDVLNYVRGGGRLSKPPHCPHILGNLMLQCWEYAPENRPSFKDCLNQLELILQDFEDNAALTSFPPLHDIHFDPYSYSDGNGSNSGGAIHYGPQQVVPQMRNEDSDAVFLHTTVPDSSYCLTNANYLEVLSEEELMCNSPTFTDQSFEGYEVPIPKRPPRLLLNNQRRKYSSSASTAEVGLPSPTYWNSDGDSMPYRGTVLQTQYRNLIASSTSEDADSEDHCGSGKCEIVDDSEGEVCEIQGHHYFSNNVSRGGNRNLQHLRKIPCHYADLVLPSSQTIFSNQSYSSQNFTPQSITNSGGGGGGRLYNYQPSTSSSAAHHLESST